MPKGLENLSMLLVDDNTHMIKIVKTILRGFGVAKFYEATDAAEAFDLVRSHSIDVIIVDYQMDLLDGTDFIRLVRTGDDVANQFVPIIMLTAHSEKNKVFAARDAGVTEFCCKPVTAKDLYKKIYSLVNAPRQFVKTGTYFGPDRRRHNDKFFKGALRRKNDEECEGHDGDETKASSTLSVQDFT